jgi:amidohydrolase
MAALEAATAAIESARTRLVALSEAIHSFAELGFEEVASAAAATELLESSGFQVDRGVCDLPTAFDARSGSGDLVIAFMAEYDALPEVGHACGHNLIATSSIGAGIGLAAVADELGIEVRVLGTPSEESGGGKALMLERGGFDGVAAAMMVHPWSLERLHSSCLAVSQLDVTFTGRTAHASAAPWEGINAGDAMVVSQVAVGLLRQQLPPGCQVHGIVVDGGQAANIIPGSSRAKYMARARTIEDLEDLVPRVTACFEAGALASGATLEIAQSAPAYTHLVQDVDLLAAYRRHAESRGRSFADDDAGLPAPTYSTDMANISLAIPSIHPLIRIETHGAVNHQPEFAAACLGPSAEAALIDGAVVLAGVAIDAAQDPDLRGRLVAGAHH